SWYCNESTSRGKVPANLTGADPVDVDEPASAGSTSGTLLAATVGGSATAIAELKVAFSNASGASFGVPTADADLLEAVEAGSGESASRFNSISDFNPPSVHNVADPMAGISPVAATSIDSGCP